ncbi:MAG: SDR family oxidoreductase [Gaiellaceae bacterium]
MKLLVLGGTKFLGRAVAEAALARGHELTLFNRGETNPGLFPEAEHLRGDRDGNLRALAGRQWDAVVDPSGYVPRVVRASAELLRESGHYVFVSSISAYAEPLPRGYDEGAPTHGDPQGESVQEEYGELKAACERMVAEVLPDRSASIRAGLIVGPHDPTDRFTYWVTRLARGGDVLAPGSPDRQVQFVDVRDLGTWIVRVAEERRAGPFTATGPMPPVTMGQLLETCRTVSDEDARLLWVAEDFLLERSVGEWMELPLWVAGDEHFMEADVSRAVAAGLTYRPVEETVRDTLRWADGAGETAAPLASGMTIGKAGMEPAREADLLAEWEARNLAGPTDGR